MSNGSAVGLSEIGQIAVVVHDLERAVTFYQEALGMKLLFRVPGLAFFAAGSVRLMLSLPEKPEFDPPGSILYFKVGDIKQVHATFKERGVSFESVVVAIETGGLIDILTHPNQAKYPRQRVLVVASDGYVFLVPFVEEDDYFFLKTIISSRKATRDYLNLGESDAED